jgi:hypothetical protein
MGSQTFLFTLLAVATVHVTAAVQGSVTTGAAFASLSTARPANTPTTPTATDDPWTCATKDYSDYLQPPKPTGHLLDVYYDHGDAIFKKCEESFPGPLTEIPVCPSLTAASWCAVSHTSNYPLWTYADLL